MCFVNYIFSDNINHVKPSAADRMLQQMGDKNLISLAGGNPSPDVFPIREIKRISAEVLSENPIEILQYSTTEGNRELIDSAWEFYLEHGLHVTTEDAMMVTSGSQQVPDLVAKCFCNAGDYVFVENPSYYLTLDTFRSYGVRLVGIPMEKDGMCIDILKSEIEKKKPKVLYCIPNYHNPTGICTSIRKRKEIYDICAQNDVIILEDNPYGEITFSGQGLPDIKNLDEKGIVILARSLSKIIAPGIRISTCIANQEIIKKMVVAKRCSDVHSNVWSQKICAKILKTIDMDAHIRKLQNYYGKKADLLQKYLGEKIGNCIQWIPVVGGMFLWITLPNSINMQEVVERLLNKKVAVVPGNIFYVDQSKECSNIRLNFSTPSEKELELAIELLAEVIRDMK